MTGPPGPARKTPVAVWLERREPASPPALRERVAELASAAGADTDPAAALLQAAEAALQRLAREGASDRATALDLLAVDALVTYAFEAAAQSPGTIPAQSADAMARLSAAAIP